MGALSTTTNTGNHKGLPLHAYDRPNWYSTCESRVFSLWTDRVSPHESERYVRSCRVSSQRRGDVAVASDSQQANHRVSYGGKNLGSGLSSAPRDRGSTKKWVGTLSDDLTGAVESSLGEVPEGWIQAYGPASIVEILHNGIPTEVELIEPLLLDPFGSATFQFWTDSAGSR